MNRTNHWQSVSYLGLLLVGLTLWRAWLVFHNDMPLYVDEAQYWYWAQQLSWGYYSKPPVIAALIAATTAVCGDGEPCVRLASVVAYPLSTLILFLLARRLFNTPIAWVASVIFITLPAVGLSSILISTDVALFFCWTLALYAFVRALASNAWRDWLLLGLALGLGMMSKYTMGIFFVSALVYLLWDGQWRVLLNGRAWTAVGVAALMFAPNLFWNGQHHFPTFQHTAEISHLEQAGLHWGSLGEFLLGQMLVFGLLFFPLLLWSIALKISSKSGEALPHQRLLLSFTLVFLVIICVQALLGQANANWAAPTYVAGSIWLAACLVQKRFRQYWVSGVLVNVLLFGGIYHFDSLWRVSGIELTARTDPYKRMRAWDKLGAQYLRIQQAYPNALPLAEERGILSELSYYARPWGLKIVSWNPHGLLRHHYDLVTSLSGKTGQSFLYVTDGELPKNIAAYFTQVSQAGVLHVPVHRDFSLDYKVYYLQAFKGL